MLRTYLLAAFGLAAIMALTAPGQAPAQEPCYTCYSQDVGPAVCDVVTGGQIGGDEPCGTTWVCHPERGCDSVCAPAGELCNIEANAVAMSGQVVLPEGDARAGNCLVGVAYTPDRADVVPAQRIEVR